MYIMMSNLNEEDYERERNKRRFKAIQPYDY